MEENLQCQLCQKKDNEGIILLNHYICRSCEKEIVKTSPEDWRYQFLQRKIKRIWNHFLRETILHF